MHNMLIHHCLKPSSLENNQTLAVYTSKCTCSYQQGVKLIQIQNARVDRDCFSLKTPFSDRTECECSFTSSFLFFLSQKCVFTEIQASALFHVSAVNFQPPPPPPPLPPTSSFHCIFIIGVSATVECRRTVYHKLQHRSIFSFVPLRKYSQRISTLDVFLTPRVNGVNQKTECHTFFKSQNIFFFLLVR